MSKRNFDFIKLFLQNSPINRHRRHREFMKIITVPQSHKVVPPRIIPDEVYLRSYIQYLQVFPVTTRREQMLSDAILKKMNSKHNFNRSSNKPASQIQQLLQNINDFTAYSNDSPTFYQELEQLITIAKPETIISVKSRLKYLFQIILNRRRDRLTPNSLELISNIELSEAIIKAFRKSAKQPQSCQQWRNLQAMQKLLRAAEYKKKGFDQQAMANFQEVFSDNETQFKIRMQALKNICSQADVSVLESMIVSTQQKGEKQFEQYIKQYIKKVRPVTSKTNDR